MCFTNERDLLEEYRDRRSRKGPVRAWKVLFAHEGKLLAPAHSEFVYKPGENFPEELQERLFEDGESVNGSVLHVFLEDPSGVPFFSSRLNRYHYRFVTVHVDPEDFLAVGIDCAKGYATSLRCAGVRKITIPEDVYNQAIAGTSVR